MTGPEMLRAYLDRKGITARDFSAQSSGRLGEPELSRYLGGKSTPSLRKAFAIEELTDRAVPASSWAKTAARRTRAKSAA